MLRIHKRPAGLLEKMLDMLIVKLAQNVLEELLDAVKGKHT